MHTSLSPAIPTIADDFNVDQALASWVMSVYMITGAVVTILTLLTIRAIQGIAIANHL